MHDLIRGDCALFNAHTNADAVAGGVAEALARAVGLADSAPIEPLPTPPLDALVTYVPQASAAAVVDAVSAAGAGSIGEYEKCAWTTEGTGQFLPGPGADPAIGSVGDLTRVAETRIEMVLPRSRRGAVLAALRAAHPYEEPAFSFIELGPTASDSGTGRIGTLAAPVPLRQFAQAVADAVPATAQGVRVSGDVDAVVRTVAVCGGSGGSLLDVVRERGADVFVTADLRHHPASESREESRGGPPFLVDLAHWASEWPWLPVVARDLAADVAALGATVETRVSRRITDPWTARFDPSTPAPTRHDETHGAQQ